MKPTTRLFKALVLCLLCVGISLAPQKSAEASSSCCNILREQALEKCPPPSLLLNWTCTVVPNQGCVSAYKCLNLY